VVFGSAGTLGRLGRLLLILAAAAACTGPTPATPATSPPPTAAAAAPAPTSAPNPTAVACSPGWGSEAKTVPELGRAPVVAVRTGTGPCADRVEFELAGPAAGYSVSYVDQVVQDGSGAVVPVPGGARLQVQLHHPAYDEAGRATLPGRAGDPVPSGSGYPSLQQVVFAGSFEGYATFGVGVRARLPFRMSIVDGLEPRSRIVLEVGHTWP
jgi:hypothetical protein